MANDKVALTGGQQLFQNLAPSVIKKLMEWQSNGEIQPARNVSFTQVVHEATIFCIANGITPDRYKPASICNALFSIGIQGLSLVKKQIYLVPCKDEIMSWRGYFGTASIMLRLPGIKGIQAYCLYEGDVFETKYNVISGKMEVVEYVPNSVLETDYAKLRGGFAVIIGADNKVMNLEVMSMAQIEKAWGMGYAYKNGNSKFHKDFTDQAVKKTVINRACKMYVNTSDDSRIQAVASLINEESIPKPFKNDDFPAVAKQELSFGDEKIDWEKLKEESQLLGDEFE